MSEWKDLNKDSIEKLGQNLDTQMEVKIVNGNVKYRICEPESTEVDMVNSPPHYQLLPGVEVIDVREALMDKMPEDINPNTVDEWSRAWEYLTRMWQKNGVEDAEKAEFYLKRLIKRLKEY